MSIALRHKRRALERHAKNKNETQLVENSKDQTLLVGDVGDDYETVLAALNLDRDRLKEIDSVPEKIELKKNELVPKYLQYLEKYRDEERLHPNAVLVWVLIWLLDIKDVERALEWATFAIKQHQHAPENFKRSLTELFAESMCDWAETEFTEGRSFSPYFEMVAVNLKEKVWLTEQPIIPGKIFKLMGQHFEKLSDDKAALDWYTLAQYANDKAGCKGKIKSLTEKLEKDKEKQV
ncbi:MAG: hypothetical protein K6L75_02450 [Cellvibrionaceae bacterium]